MNIERLSELIIVLKKAAKREEKLNMSNWVISDSIHGDWGEDKNGVEFYLEGFCGTASCAIGHAMLDKGFQGQGLLVGIDYLPYYKGFQEDEAITQFFELTMDQVAWLFMPENYESDESASLSPLKVVTRIERMIHHHEMSQD